MAQITTSSANISSSKRSFEETAHYHSQVDCINHQPAHYATAVETSNHARHCCPPYSPSKKRPSFSRPTIMLSEHSSIMSGSFPSFMSVYGSEESGLYRPIDVDYQSKIDENAFPLTTTQNANTQPPQQQHQHLHHSKPYDHRGSITSFISTSTDSSPTTTNSTFDSPSVSDTSASSSPGSATSGIPSTPFRKAMLSPGGQSIAQFNENKLPYANTQQPQTMQEGPKNLKKLTLDMNIPSLRRPVTSQGVDDPQPFSAPTSPLKEGMKSARKKPTNLTIRTPGYNQLTFPKAASNNIPATPGHRPALHHIQSSPALSALASPGRPPAGGMFLPLPSLNTSHSKQNPLSSSGNSFLASSMPNLREENEDIPVPKSQEAPERGYTNGPVCIYDCGVYLYLEPTAEEACKFDTVINVAKEVRNPLKEGSTGEGTVMSVWRSDGPRQSIDIPEPQTALSDFSFKSAWEYPRPESRTGLTTTTPTQSSFSQQPKQPEYVHVRWDHNSEILEDLYPLCKMIDDRIARGRKVLVHCQLGVSRSASLIIAYGLFKNYQPNFHAMYMAVKERSRWVGPNMSLIYQLTDFKSKINRGDYEHNAKELKPEWSVRSPEGPATPIATESAPAATQTNPAKKAIEAAAISEPKKTTPLKLNKALPPVPLFPKNNNNNTTQPVPKTTPIIPQPPSKGQATVKRAASRPLPFRERGMDMTIPAHKPKHIPGITLSQSSAVMDLAMKDVPNTPSLFSPRASEFMATPFGIRGAGDLETPGNRMSKDLPVGFNMSWLPLRKDGHVRTASKDPRSPHQQAEAKEIFRSIDRYL